MPRPSRRAERAEEILDAYERCIAVHGVEGATLERIAGEAGLARALIRHNVGNKDQLLEAFLDRFLNDSAEDMAGFFGSLPNENRLPIMIDRLFDARYADLHSVEVTNALVIAASRRPDLAKRLRRWILDFVDEIMKQLAIVYSSADEEALDAVASGIAAIYFNQESLAPLGRMPGMLKKSKNAARLLVSTLEHSFSWPTDSMPGRSA